MIGEGAHVGNFVELKKTTLGKGAKANHLSYVGDTTIGNDANLGAGTITANYDHITKIKSRTVIGDQDLVEIQICTKYNTTPPPEVIATGCEAYVTDVRF